MPFLLPPPEFRPGELIQLGLTGTCELQVCRSAGPWSLGTPGRIEHSIQNAYLKGPFFHVFFHITIYILTRHLLNICLHGQFLGMQQFKCRSTLCILKTSFSSRRKS